MSQLRDHLMAYETLILEIEDHVALIKLNRPEAMNALNAQLLAELADSLAGIERNEKVRCTVLAGNEKAFAAGADVAELADKTFPEMFCGDPFLSLSRQLSACRKPMVAAVSGYATGAGCELALACDLIIAAETAKFGQPEVSLGITSALGGTQRLVRAVGKAKAMDMVLTGRFLSAEEAERAGLVSRVVPVKKLADETRAVAQKIAEKSRLTVMAVKECVDRAFETPLNQGIAFERRMFQALFATADQAEGMAAFLEKRDPQFRDK